MLKSTRQLGWVFQEMEPPKFSTILLNSSDMQKPIHRVKFTKAIARHAKNRDQTPSLGMICHSGKSKVPCVLGAMQVVGGSRDASPWQALRRLTSTVDVPVLEILEKIAELPLRSSVGTASGRCGWRVEGAHR